MGRLVTRVTNDVQNMHEMFTSVVTFVFKDLFLLIGITIVLLTLNVKLALIAFVVLPVVFFTAYKFADIAREAFRTLRVKIAEINSAFSETIEGIRVVQLFRQEKRNYRTFKRLNREHYEAGIVQVKVFAVFMPVIEIMGSAAVAAVIFYGGRGVIGNDVTLGDLVAFLSYMRMFSTSSLHSSFGSPPCTSGSPIPDLLRRLGAASTTLSATIASHSTPPPPFRQPPSWEGGLGKRGRRPLDCARGERSG